MRQGLPLLCGQDNLHLVLIILGLELPIPLFKIAYQVFSGGMERKLACISEMYKSAQDQLNSTFIHAWEQELCINWLWVSVLCLRCCGNGIGCQRHYMVKKESEQRV